MTLEKNQFIDTCISDGIILIGNKGRYPTLFFAFCKLHEKTSNINKEQGKLITLT